ncbi:hypothetical protein UA08_02387 [Talaromyces atroroseus]|uniref:NADP-dependent oxidoreductase domain-containing protein n=1 Tax=Talaromyces atroroseus TaxID=1441469 RepID=A0A225AKR1_TALAT|nr:hypothetical protein UA08_02387 [Talaromyces atroroseus]OKL62151.1 hypothetical protein UA08_02387 [Talaromyces atroroseus]
MAPVRNAFRTRAPKPKSLLGYHRVLSPPCTQSFAIMSRVDEFWHGMEFMGECPKEDAFVIMDTFYENGGNFIDTSSNYHFEESEQRIGEWMKARGNRDTMVLEKLQTDYIDILYVHLWDLTTSVEELMHGLNALITAGKVLYLGISDTPAWAVVKANDYARAHGLRPFSIYQGSWNAMLRDMEPDIIPLCRDQGMAIAPFGSLGQGKFKTTAARESEHTGSGRAAELSENEIRISDALEAIANRKSSTLHAVASLISAEKYDLNMTAADIVITKFAAHIDAPRHQQAIKPRKGG